MMSTALGTDFGFILGLCTWVILPLYGAWLGLMVTSARGPVTNPGGTEATPTDTLPALGGCQVAIFAAAAALATLYRGYDGTLAQGQVFVGHSTARAHSAVVALGVVGMALLAPSYSNPQSASLGLGLAPLSLAPTMVVLWSLLPLVTQISTALLVLELVGVVLIWAISSAATSGVGAGQSHLCGPVQGIILFVWASGLSALALLLGLGLGGLGSGLNGSLPLVSSVAPSQGGLILAIVLSLKFLVGGGQFLLMAWYRYLTPEALAFYMVFYYPPHLVVGLGVLAALALAQLQVALAIILAGLGLGLIALVPHLGAQSSPSSTLAGSSFVGLALIVLGFGA